MKTLRLILPLFFLNHAWAANLCQWSLGKDPFVRLAYLAYEKRVLSLAQIQKLESLEAAKNPLKESVLTPENVAFFKAFEQAMRSREIPWSATRQSLNHLIADLRTEGDKVEGARADTSTFFSPQLTAEFPFARYSNTQMWMQEKSGRFLIATGNKDNEISIHNLFTGELVWKLPCKGVGGGSHLASQLSMLQNAKGDLEVYLSLPDAILLTATVGEDSCRDISQLFPAMPSPGNFRFKRFPGGRTFILHDTGLRDGFTISEFPSRGRSVKISAGGPQTWLQTNDGRVLLATAYEHDSVIKVIIFGQDHSVQEIRVGKMENASASVYQTNDDRIFVAFGNTQATKVKQLFTGKDEVVNFVESGTRSFPIFHETKDHRLLVGISGDTGLSVYEARKGGRIFNVRGDNTEPIWMIGPQAQDLLITNSGKGLMVFNPDLEGTHPVGILPGSLDLDDVLHHGGNTYFLTDGRTQSASFFALYRIFSSLQN